MIPKGLIKKKYRKIIVQDEVYAWKFNESFLGDSFGIIIHHIASKKVISCLFEHRINLIPAFHQQEDKGLKSYARSFFSKNVIITPSVVKDIIEFILKSGWNFEDNYGLDLNNDFVLDSNWKKTEFPKLERAEVALICYDNLKPLDFELNEFIGYTEFYRIFENKDSAIAYALINSNKNPSYKFWILKSFEQALSLVFEENIFTFTSNKVIKSNIRGK